MRKLSLKKPSIIALGSTIACIAIAADFDNKLSGDWNGLRTQLKDSGVEPFLYYDSIAAANVSGGIDEDDDYTGQIYAGAHFIFNESLQGRLSYVNRHGNTISANVGGIYDPMTIYGGQVNYLYEAWLEKTFNAQWALKFGRLSADADFANSDMFRYSSSTAINGPSRPMLLESSITSFPYAMWGARLKYNDGKDGQWQFGITQIGEKMWDYTEHGTNFDIDGDDGWTALAQYDWTPALAHGKARFYAGIAQSFYDFNDFNNNDTTDSFTRLYGYGEIKTSERTTVFGAITYADQDEVARTPFQLNAGINTQGLIAARPNDKTFAHFTYGALSDALGDSVNENLDYEAVFEVGHRIQLAPAVYVQPAIQYIDNPGGTGNIDDAIVVGVWFGLSF